MEILLYAALGIIGFIGYGAISIAIFDKFLKSSGISRIFWFMVMIGTLSFLFGSSNSSSSFSSNNNYGGGGYVDDYCQDSDNCSSCDDDYSYNILDNNDCSWSDDNCGCSFDDDDD